MIRLHMLCSWFSYGAFLIAFLTGWLFLVQERQLKRKHMGRLFHWLPPLGALDQLNFIAIGVGFALFSLGMALGFMGERRLLGTWWTHDPKEYLSVGLWATYCVLWLVRLRATLRGRRVALLSILGFGLVLFTSLGARWLLPSWHATV